MYRWVGFLVVFMLAGMPVWAQGSDPITFSDMKVEPNAVSAGNRMLLSAKVTHVGGPASITLVAALATVGNTAFSYANLFDDGSNGDLVAGDGVYSLAVDAPNEKGEGKIVFIAVGGTGIEKQSDAVAFVVK